MKYTKLKRNIWIGILILLVIMLAVLLIYYYMKVRSYNESGSNLISNKKGYIEEGLDLQEVDVDSSLSSALYSVADILNHYKERIGEDFAFLILNEAVILEYKEYRNDKLNTAEIIEDVEETEEHSYFVYYLGDEDNNIIQKYIGKTGETYEGVFYNFNRLLLDKVILQDMSGNFISERGFSTSLMKDMNLTLDTYITVNEEEKYMKNILYNVKQEEIGVVYILSTLTKGGN